ncbi:MAG: transketolase, partial [Candidatus Marinimicrobia bacterium]|nr:transketolase [Candidatus Neomarinimicrobiota bacterium]
MADTATILWTKFLRHHPEHSHWVGRDRFILSPGHGSTLLYSLLHLSGYDLSLEDLKDFRQWGSKTPGHPEYGHTHGVEVTTGPLGQGFANGVGMAIAAKKLEADAAQYTNTPKMPGQRIWAIVSDGDMMEGITHEAASFAGHLKLDNMIYIYDKNNISIEGNTDIAFTESVEDRFKAYGWHTLNMDAHNHEEIEQTLTEAMTLENAPVLIIATSHIGFGSPNKQDSAGVHGAPLGADELALTKKNFGFNEMDSFVVPEDVYGVFAERKTELDKIYKDWCEQLEFLRRSDKKAAALWDETMTSPDNAGLWQKLQSAVSGSSMASRKASGNMLQIIAENIPG